MKKESFVLMKKILIFDLDGTIVVDSRINPKLSGLIKELSKSHMVIFASGRMFSSMDKLLKKNALSGIEIAYNGALIHLSDIFYKFCLDLDDALSILDFLRKEKIHRQIYVDNPFYATEGAISMDDTQSRESEFRGDLVYVEEENEFSRAYSQQAEVEYKLVQNLDDVAKSGCVFKILAFDVPDKIKSTKEKALKALHKNADIFTSSKVYLEFVKKGINKKSAVEFISQKLNFSFKDVVAFGDGENDSELLEKSGISFAMVPGDEKIRKIATYVSDNDDGMGVFRSLKYLESVGEI